MYVSGVLLLNRLIELTGTQLELELVQKLIDQMVELRMVDSNGSL